MHGRRSRTLFLKKIEGVQSCEEVREEDAGGGEKKPKVHTGTQDKALAKGRKFRGQVRSGRGQYLVNLKSIKN